MPVQLRPSTELSHGELATVFTAAYEGYFVPFAVDEATLRYMVDVFDLDLGRSLVAVDDGAPVGLANLGRRGARTWLGGVGVVASRRGEGIGELLTRRLLEQFVAHPGAVTEARVRVLQSPLAVQGATEAFGDWLLEFLTSAEVALSTHADAYGNLAIPTLVVWGDRDTTTPLPQGQRLAQLIAGARLAVMPGVGHMPQIEDPVQFNRLLLTFLQASDR